MASIKTSERLVIKVGSALLVERGSGKIKHDWLAGLAADVAELRALDIDVLLVSSGSIALGRRVLNLPEGDLTLKQSQAAAAVGQIQLATAYEEAMAPHGLVCGQILMTLEDSQDRRRYLNSRATISTMLELGVVPIVNENDTIATDEIRFGDNDRLAAQVAGTVDADTLVLLSDIDGMYTANPATDPTATRFEMIEEITPEIEAMAGDPVSGLSKGGMKTKIMAAKTAVAAGCWMVITEGSPIRPLAALEAGANATWFKAQTDPQSARKGWISAMKPRGELTIDDGAFRALVAGNSLLPAGVTDVIGAFGRGDAVALVSPSGAQLGVGLIRYSNTECEAIAGHQTDEIEEILGYSGRSEMIHRDDMVL